MTNHHHYERTCRPRAGVSRRGRRVPFRPLEDWLNARYRNPSASADFQTGGQLTAPTIGAIIGVTRQTLYRWRDKRDPMVERSRRRHPRRRPPPRAVARLPYQPDYHR